MVVAINRTLASQIQLFGDFVIMWKTQIGDNKDKREENL